jgi:hypothetical protein
MMDRAGSQSTFKEGRDDLKIYGGLEATAKRLNNSVFGGGPT